MATTKKPSGLTIKRSGLKFTINWKIADKNYGNGQQLQFAVFTSQAKYESAINFIKQGFTITKGFSWQSVSVGASATKGAFTLSASAYFPTAKKPYLAGIIVRVRGNRSAYTEKEKYKDSHGRTKYRNVTVNPGWSAWAYKGFDIVAPAAPSTSINWSEEFTNRTTFGWDAGTEQQTAPFTRCEYQTITALDYNGKVENMPGWKNATSTNVGRNSSIYRDEADLADKNLTRAYRVRAVGPGGVSAWRYRKHAYGAPNEAINVICEATRIESAGSYHLVISWDAPAPTSNPIDKTTAEYLIAEPAGIADGQLIVPGEAQWTPFSATKDTSGTNSFSYDLPATLAPDQCLWIHVVTTHDNHDTPSEAVLAVEGNLANPTITNLQTEASTYRAEITITPGTSVPGAFHAIVYEPADGSENPDAGKIIGIIENGMTSAQVQCPEWSSTPGFGVYAVAGTVESYYERTSDGVFIYTLNEIMTSGVEITGGQVPQAPTRVTAQQIGTTNAAQVVWDVPWKAATGAEVSWADHEDAWWSTEQPQTFEVENLKESKLSVTGLELGKFWYFRVRLYKTNASGTDIFGPYSETVKVDLSTIPAVPELTISDADGIIAATGSVVASWIYVSADGTRQKAATLAEYTEVEGEPVYTPLVQLSTQQQATLDAETLGWENGTQHDIVVQVISESGNPSKWSAPVTITIADAISCDITQTSLEYDNVPVNPETYTGNPITLNGGDETNLKEVTALNVELTPIQDLNGYDKPWAAGAGKNKFGFTVSDFDNGSVFGIGTFIRLNLSAGSYTLSTNAPTGYLWFGVNKEGDDIGRDTTRVYEGSPLAVTVTDEYFAVIGILTSDKATALSYKTQLEQGTTATTYEPYSNNCPIYPHTSLPVRDTGINQWDEEWELGTFNTTTGADAARTDQIRAKNRIPVKPSTTYYFKTPSYVWTIFYDGDGNVIPSSQLPSGNYHHSGNSLGIGTEYDSIITMPNNCYAIRFYCQVGYGATYKNDIAINYPSTDHDYHPYTGQTVTVPLNDLYGGTVDVIGGQSSDGWANIPSYNGETISEPWLSSMDEYVQGATPTTGAQVTYKLATPTPLTTTPTALTLYKGDNVISSDGDMEITTADAIESGYYLKELPLTATVTGAGTGGQTNVTIERAEDYDLDRPDETRENYFEGAMIAQVQQPGDGQIEIRLEDLHGRHLDDGARYRITASVQDSAGQTAKAEPIEFIVSWLKQATIPDGTVELQNGIAIITPTAGTGGNVDDTVDIYRLSSDEPELIIKDGTFGTQYVDPYPTLNEHGGYRIVTKTVYGDYITAGNEFAWTDIRTLNDSLFQYIDFDGNQLELRYNAELSASGTKQFTATHYLGGSIQGDWLEGATREASVNGVVLRDIDQDTYRTLRALMRYSGICHVRTTDGANFTANVNVQSGSTYNSPGHPESVSLTITRVDNPRADGMTLAEWQPEEE